MFLITPCAGLKYDLKKVEEVLYDVKIRGLMSTQATANPMESWSYWQIPQTLGFCSLETFLEL